MKINPELFVIRDGKDFILYAPLQKSILKVSSGVAKYLQKIKKGKRTRISSKIKKQLIETRVLLEDKDFNKFSENFKDKQTEYEQMDYKPTNVTLIPTWDCNLRCTYCYSRGGEETGNIMDFDVAKTAIDLIIENALEDHSKNIITSFHGGGEPLLNSNMDFIKRVTEYFKKETEKHELKSHVCATTNGILNKKDLEWIINNFNYLTVSFDGPEEIQNRQRPFRPLKDGESSRKGSFNAVMKTIEYLEDKKFPYGIKATITNESVSEMPKIVKFFNLISPSSKSFHPEPAFECGRYKTTNVLAPDPKEFLKYTKKAKEKAKELGIEFYYSCSGLEQIDYKFCGATGTNFFVTPRGDVTSCLRVTRPNDDMADIFLIGKYNYNSKKFEFDNEKIHKLRKRVVQNINGCANCFAKYNCVGDCLAVVYPQTRDLYDTEGNFRCEINRGLLLHEIKQKLKRVGKK